MSMKEFIRAFDGKAIPTKEELAKFFESDPIIKKRNPRRRIGQMVKLKNGREGLVIGQSYATQNDFLCRFDVRIDNKTYEVKEDELIQ